MTIAAKLRHWMGIAPSDSGCRLEKAIEECMRSEQTSVETCKQKRAAAVKARTATDTQLGRDK